MKKILSRLWKILILAIAVGIWWGINHFYQKNKTPEVGPFAPMEDSYFTAERGSMTSEIRVSGETNLLNEQELKFNLDGTVVALNVSEGSEVKKGDILARLDTKELQSELKQAQIDLENARDKLKSTQEKLSGEDRVRDETDIENQKRKIALAERDLTKTKEDQLTAQEELRKGIAEAELALDKLKKESTISKDKLDKNLADQKEDLEYKKKTFEDKKWNLQKDIADTDVSLTKALRERELEFINTYQGVFSSVNSWQDTLDSINEIIAFDRVSKNIPENLEFSAKNYGQKQEILKQFIDIQKAVYDLKTLYESKKTAEEPTLEYLITLLEKEKKIYDLFYAVGQPLLQGVEDSSEGGRRDLSGLKSTAKGFISSSEAKKLDIDAKILTLEHLDSPADIREKSRIAKEALEKQLEDLDKDLVDLQKAVDDLALLYPENVQEIQLQIEKQERQLKQLREDYDERLYKDRVTLEDQEISLKNARQDLEIAQTNFTKKYANISENEDIKMLQNSVKQAELAVEKVEQKIENYLLKAPFDGVVSALSYKVGDNLSTNSNDNKNIYIVNPSIMEVTMQFDAIDVVKVEKGMEAQVSFDAFPGKFFSGNIESIDTKAKDGGGWGAKKYAAKMMINTGETNVLSGMQARVRIVFEEKNDIIVIPTMAIEYDTSTGEPYVTVRKNGKNQKTPVQIGMTQDGQTEILSGIEEWDEILRINFDANQFTPDDFNPYRGRGGRFF